MLQIHFQTYQDHHSGIAKYVRFQMIFFFFSEVLMSMNFTRKEVEESLKNKKFDDIMALYLLLNWKTPEVGC